MLLPLVANAAKVVNGRLSNVECYVLGFYPASKTNDFKIVSFPMGRTGSQI